MGRVRAERQRLLRCLGHSEADRQKSTPSRQSDSDPTQPPKPSFTFPISGRPSAVRWLRLGVEKQR